jgi:hypothetical protein
MKIIPASSGLSVVLLDSSLIWIKISLDASPGVRLQLPNRHACQARR